MLSRARGHLTYANVVSTLSLFVLLGGSAYAATKIGSKQIKDNSIQSKDIKDNGIRGKDVKNGSLVSTDFKAGSLPVGPTGPRGAAGPRGSTGPAGTARAYAMIDHGVLVASRSKGILGMSPGCDSGSPCNPPSAGSGSPHTYCFLLAFVPSNVQITPATVGTSSANAVAGFSGIAPAPAAAPTAPHCPAGYLSAMADVYGNNYDAQVTGFYVAFN